MMKQAADRPAVNGSEWNGVDWNGLDWSWSEVVVEWNDEQGAVSEVNVKSKASCSVERRRGGGNREVRP